MNIWSFFIDRIKLTWLLLIAIFIAGIYSYAVLPRESNIDIDIPIGIVSTFYEGAEPKDIERLVTDVLEKEIDEIEGIKKIESTSSRSISSIVVEFEADEDVDTAIRALKDKINEAEGELPSAAETPTVNSVRFGDRPVMIFSLAGDYTPNYLSDLAEDVQDKLEKISDISRVEISGDTKRAFRIKLQQEKIEGLGLTTGEIINAIQSSDKGFPMGKIEVDKFEYGIRLQNRIETIEDIKKIPIRSKKNGFLYLGDVAHITDDIEDIEVIQKVSTKQPVLAEDGTPTGEEIFVANNTISLSVYKTSKGSVINVSKKVKQYIEDNPDGIIPKNVKYAQIINFADFIEKDFKVLSGSALQTITLIVIFLIIFLGKRESLIAAISIPISFFIVFTYMQFTGMKLNGITLFSLVIGLGLLVDTAIVMVEGLHENIARKKMNRREGALLTIKQYNKPLLSGTLTTISAFIPMFMVSGIMGEYLRVIPTVLIILLSASYIIAIFFIPAIGTKFMTKEIKKESWFDKLMHRYTQKYNHFIKTIIGHKKRENMIIWGSGLIFIVALALPVTGILQMSMFPNSDSEFFEVNVELPNGSTKEQTMAKAQQVQKIITAEPGVDYFSETIGGKSNMMEGGSSSAPHLAYFLVQLVDEDQRDLKSFQITEKLEERMKLIPGIKVSVENPKKGPPSGAPIEVRFTGDDLATLTSLTKELEKRVSTLPGIQNTSTNVEEGAGEFIITPRKEILDFYGINMNELAQTTRTHIDNFKVKELLLDGDKINIRLESGDKATSPTQIQTIRIGKDQVPLEELSDISLAANISKIQHRNQSRYTFMRANINADTNATEMNHKIEKIVKEIIPVGIEYEFGGETEDVTQSLKDMFQALIVGIILILLILIIQFNSYIQSLIVLSMVPLSLIGVFVLFTIIRLPLSFLSFIGIVGLAGIVVNDAIILVDKANINKTNIDAKEVAVSKKRADHKIHSTDMNQACIEAGTARLQPIFLTSLTTVFGMVPLLFVDPMWRDFALVIIFGLTVSTIFALTFVPVAIAKAGRRK